MEDERFVSACGSAIVTCSRRISGREPGQRTPSEDGGGRRRATLVVGDARQSIYRFRGASSENMVRFATDYPGAVIDQLA